MVTASATTNSATVTWRIPSFTTQEDYYVLYSKDPANLDQRTNPIPSVSDTTVTNHEYELTVDGLDSGSVYYLRVVAVFDILSKRQSELVVIWTNDEGIYIVHTQSTYLVNILYFYIEQAYYLEFMEHSDLASSSGVVEPCSDGCTSSEIVFPYDIPFGGYFHRTAFVSWIIAKKRVFICFFIYYKVSTNGAITFGEALENQSPEQFPLTFWSFLIAPLWVNVNTMAGGNVLWEIYDSSELLAMVDMLIQQEQGDSTFNGLWMLVASWEDVEFTDQEDNIIVSNISTL